MSTNTKLAEALRDAATSLETIGRLAGKPYYGRDDQGEPIQTYMGHNDEVRSYAKSRAGCAREALAAHDAEQAANAVPADLRSAAERTRQDLGPTGSNYPDVRVLLAFAEQALAAPTPPAPEAQQPAGRASVDDWEQELCAVMPADLKDWWQNSRREWPAVAAAVIKSLQKRCDAGWEVAALAQRRGEPGND